MGKKCNAEGMSASLSWNILQALAIPLVLLLHMNDVTIPSMEIPKQIAFPVK
jgi:hypothetical protein